MARVLVVDDDTAALEIRKRILERNGYEVSIATDAAGAREAFRAGPETVVLDMRLPEASDGRALIREFRAASAQVRIVVLCGFAADLDNRPERALVNAVLEKPIRSEQLLAAILSPVS
jgi:CheY-like chemotaxis protein